MRIAAQANCIKMIPLRLAELISQFLLTRRSLATIDKPPPINPSRRKCRTASKQMEFCYG
jgi:putative transposase